MEPLALQVPLALLVLLVPLAHKVLLELMD
jgi:hypothetical protein